MLKFNYKVKIFLKINPAGKENVMQFVMTPKDHCKKSDLAYKMTRHPFPF